MLIKANFVKQFIDDAKIILEHLSSDMMSADHLTKPLTKLLFNKFTNDYFK